VIEDLTVFQWGLLICTPLFAYTIKGVTGFGPALLIMPAFSVVFSPYLALGYSAVMDGLVGAYMMYASSISRSDIEKSGHILFYAVLGAGLGGIILTSISQNTVLVVVALLTLIFGFYYLFENSLKSKKIILKLPLPVGSVIGGIAGVVSGISGPPIIVALTGHADKTSFRNILVTVFLCMSILKIGIYIYTGVFSAQILPLVLLTFPSVAAGLWCGYKIHGRVSEVAFFKCVMLILILAALISIIKATGMI